MGGYALYHPDGSSLDVPTRKSWGMLAYLCQVRGRDIPREEVADLLWPRGTGGAARASLRQELAVLRRALAQGDLDGMQTAHDRLRLELPGDRIDSVELERQLDLGGPDNLRMVLTLYRGEFLAGLNLRVRPFEEWVWLERQRIKTRVIDALQKLLQYDLDQDAMEPATATAQKLLEIDPTQELAYRALMQIYRQTDRRSDALKLFQQCRVVLWNELEAEPSGETTELAQQIREETAGAAKDVRVTRRNVAVLCLIPATHGEDVDPVVLAEWQTKVLIAARQRVNGAGGWVMSGGLGDRVIALFDEVDACVKAHHAASDLLVGRRTEGFDLCAGLAHGEMLVADARAADPVLIGAPLARATRRALAAEPGHVVTGADLDLASEQTKNDG